MCVDLLKIDLILVVWLNKKYDIVEMLIKVGFGVNFKFG